MIVVTSFDVRHDGGPTVTATRKGTTWSFSWPGRMSGSSGALVACDYETAKKIATEVAQRIADLEPYRQEVMRRQEDVAEWVDAQREPTG